MRSYRCAASGRFCPPVSSQEMTQIICVFRRPQRAPFWHNVPVLAEHTRSDVGKENSTAAAQEASVTIQRESLPGARAFFENLLARNKARLQALIAVARKFAPRHLRDISKRSEI